MSIVIFEGDNEIIITTSEEEERTTQEWFFEGSGRTLNLYNKDAIYYSRKETKGPINIQHRLVIYDQVIYEK